MQPLLAAPRAGLTEAVVRSALSLDRVPKIRHGVDVLDTADRQIVRPMQVLGGAVAWSYRPPTAIDPTAAAAVRRTAQLQVVGPSITTSALLRYRPWTEWQASGGQWVRFWLGVFVPALSPLVDDGTLVSGTLQLADKGTRLDSTPLVDPLTVTAGTDPCNQVKVLLASWMGETSYAIGGTDVTLADDMVFDAGTSRLAVLNALLQNAGYDTLTFDEAGHAASVPLASIAGRGVEIIYGPASIDSGRIVTAGQVEPLLPSLVNQVRFVARGGPTLQEEGNGFVTVTNQSTGPASVDQRGEVVPISVDVDAEDETALEALAAAQAQLYFAGGGLRFTGKVALNPRHSDRDVIELNKPRLGLSGAWNLTSWTYPLRLFQSQDDVLMPITAEQRVVVT